MNTKHLTHKLSHSRILVFAVALLGGLALTLALLWTLGQSTPAAAAPAFDQAPSLSKEPALSLSKGEAAKPLYRPLQASDSSWTTQTVITIHSTSLLTDYQISLIIPYAAGMQADFDDLRFGDTDGNCLSYWVQTYTVASTATVWMKVPLISPPTTPIYMYYGNPSASSASDGDATFEFFDDFEGTSLDTNKWVHNGGSYSVGNSEFTGVGPLDWVEWVKTNSYQISGNKIVEFRLKPTADHTDWDAGICIGEWKFTDETYNHCGNCMAIDRAKVWGNYTYISQSRVDNDYHDYRVVLDGSTAHFHDDTISRSHTSEYAGAPGGEIPEGYIFLFSDPDGANRDAKYDWIFVRKYASTVPTTTLPGSPTLVLEDLAITKSVTPTRPNSGGPITYTITFSSAGSSGPVTDIVITDIVPVSVTNTHVVSSASSGVVITQTLRYVWEVSDLDQGEGGVITITGKLSPTLPGGHVFANTVTGTAASDSCPCNNSDTAAVSVNHPPTTTVGIDIRNVGLCYSGQVFTTTIGDDWDSVSQLDHRWTVNDPTMIDLGPPLNLRTPFTVNCGATEGIYTFTLTVTDTGGLTVTATVTVLAKNVQVTGTWATNNSPTTLGCETTINAGVEAGSSVTYTWDFGDGTGGAWGYGKEVVTDHVYPITCAPITYTVRVTASNTIKSGGGSTHTEVATTTIVNVANNPPVAVADAQPPADAPNYQTTIGSDITLDASGSSDPDSPCHYITNYHWEQISGEPVTLSDPYSQVPTFTAPLLPESQLPEKLVFQLTVTDTGCLTDADRITITLVIPGRVDLSTWIHTDLQTSTDEASDWRCPPDKKMFNWSNIPGTTNHDSTYWVDQLENAEDPTFYVSPSGVPFSTTVSGKFGAYASGTTDYFGFVFGYQEPQSKTKNFEFALVDWSWGESSNKGSGVTLGKVDYDYTNICISHAGQCTHPGDGPPPPPCTGSYVNWFWYTPKDDPAVTCDLGCTTLVSDTTLGNSKGWDIGTLYTFTFSYTQKSAHILIYEDGGSPIFDLSCNAATNPDCTFEEGRFGFYNYSQNYVMYGKFQVSGGRVAVEAHDDYYKISQGTTLVVHKPKGILINDLSPLTKLESNVRTGPAHGDVKLNLDGSFVYTPTEESYSGPDSFTYWADDGEGNQDWATVYIMVNIAPEVDLDDTSPGLTSTATFTEDEGAVAIMPHTVLTDADDTTLERATATISNPLDGNLESLWATSNFTINVSYDSATGELLLQGTDTITNYRNVLRTVVYSNTSQNPDVTDRIVQVRVHDGTEWSNVPTSTITIIPVNDPPTAIAWAHHTVVCINYPGVLVGSDSYDHPDEKYYPLSYGWTHNGTGVTFDPSATLSRTTFSAGAQFITFTLTVTDSPPGSLMSPLTATAEVGILVADQHIKGLTATNDSPTMIGDTTSLSATIDEGCSVTYTWDFGDGITGTMFNFPPIGQFPTHIYGAPGIYIAIVTATNPLGDVVTATTEVLILAPIGGHTEPASPLALLWPWAAVVAMLGAVAVVTAAALGRHAVHREFP